MNIGRRFLKQHGGVVSLSSINFRHKYNCVTFRNSFLLCPDSELQMEFKEEGGSWYNSICTNRIKKFIYSISIYWSPLFSPGFPLLCIHTLDCLPFSKLPLSPAISSASLLPSLTTQTWKINLISVSNFSRPILSFSLSDLISNCTIPLKLLSERSPVKSKSPIAM